MAFIIRKRESYSWTVTHALEKVGGKLETVTFDVIFKALPQSKIEDLIVRARDSKISDRQMIDEIVVGWRGLSAEEGGDFAFSAENVDKLLELFPGIGAAIASAWSESVLGQAASRKN